MSKAPVNYAGNNNAFSPSQQLQQQTIYRCVDENGYQRNTGKFLINVKLIKIQVSIGLKIIDSTKRANRMEPLKLLIVFHVTDNEFH